jgi:type III restriction enzyme
LATYHPDFIVATAQKIYLIETKGNDKVFDRNVQRKQRAALQWTRRINALPSAAREGRQWEYVLLSEDNFYSLLGSGATLTDICEVAKVSPQAATGNLFSGADD